MPNMLSSEAAKVFAVAGGAILGLVAANQIQKRTVGAWRNWRSNKKTQAEPAK